MADENIAAMPDLPADLPEDWVWSQIVSPNGIEVGQAAQYGYNYLMQAVNNTQKAVNLLKNLGGSLTAEQVAYLHAALPGVGNVKQALDAFLSHNTDPESHPDIRGLIMELDGRLGRLEDMIINDVTGNPFLITFDTLDGLTVTGVWNKAQRRIEF